MSEHSEIIAEFFKDTYKPLLNIGIPGNTSNVTSKNAADTLRQLANGIEKGNPCRMSFFEHTEPRHDINEMSDVPTWIGRTVVIQYGDPNVVTLSSLKEQL